MTAIANLPDIRPSLLLDFANSGRVDPRIQCTRASSATCFGPDGKLRTVAANVPRIDYDPATGKCLGLFVEESRTNLLISSSAFGAAGWTPYSAILQETAITSSLGAKLQKFLIPTGYTASNSSIRHSDITKSASSITYTLTVIAKAGENNFLRLLPRDVATSSNSVDARFNLTTGETFPSIASGTYNLVSTSMKHLGDGLYECAVVFTTGTETGIRVQILQMLNNGTAIGNDIDGIYLAGSQLEVGSFPTSYIPTEASAVTRAADVLQMVGANFTSWYLEREGTFLSTASTYTNALTDRRIISVNNGTAANNLGLHYGATSPGIHASIITKDGVNQFGVNDGAYSAGSFAKRALAYKANAPITATNGVLGSTAGAITALPPAPANKIEIGNRLENQFLCGHIAVLAYYPKRLTDLQLQRLTA